MEILLHCISLRVVKHSDTSSIATVWTREKGRLAVAVPAGAGKDARRKRALMMPFSVFECVGHLHPGREIIRVSDVRPFGAGNVSAADPVKNVVAMFLGDFLYAVLRESQPDANLTDFIFDAVEVMKMSSGIALANFHLYFLYKLSGFLGIAPDTGTYARGRFFDMAEGVFTPTAPINRSAVDPMRAKVLWVLSRIGPGTLGRLRVRRDVRNEILDRMLEYYGMHYNSLSSLSSLQILRSVMGQ